MAKVKKKLTAKKKPAAAKKKASAPRAKPKAKAKPRKAAAAPKAKAKPKTQPKAKAEPKKKPAAPKPRAGTTVDDYVAKQGSWQKGVIAQLREILREGAPGATEELQGGQPVYDWNGPFAQIHALPKAVEFGFWRGGSMTDPQGLLSGKGAGMKVVKITPPANVERQAFVALVREAVRLNDELGDPTRR